MLKNSKIWQIPNCFFIVAEDLVLHKKGEGEYGGKGRKGEEGSDSNLKAEY